MSCHQLELVVVACVRTVTDLDVTQKEIFTAIGEAWLVQENGARKLGRAGRGQRKYMI
jgi:hypothetical protein